MTAPEVLVVRTGTANLASALAGIERAGGLPRIGSDPSEVESAPIVMLPGVGAFGAIMEQLEVQHLVEPLRARLASGKPTLAVCLGLQIFAQSSSETPGIKGLGILPGTVTRFPDTVVVPQLGWNRVEPMEGCRLLQPGFAYFANSYRIEHPPEGWHTATADHAGPFVAAIERGPILACQFHPELSGAWGLDLLKRWLAVAREEGGRDALS